MVQHLIVSVVFTGTQVGRVSPMRSAVSRTGWTSHPTFEDRPLTDLQAWTATSLHERVMPLFAPGKARWLSVTPGEPTPGGARPARHEARRTIRPGPSQTVAGVCRLALLSCVLHVDCSLFSAGSARQDHDPARGALDTHELTPRPPPPPAASWQRIFQRWRADEDRWIHWPRP